MAIQNVVFGKQEGNPAVEVLIGQAHHGSYRVYLWDSDGKNPTLIGSGVNWDEIEDVIDLGDVNNLDQKIITWEIAISAEDSGPGQTYAAKVTFKQHSGPVEQGNFEEQGPLDGSKYVYGARKILVG